MNQRETNFNQLMVNKVYPEEQLLQTNNVLPHEDNPKPLSDVSSNEPKKGADEVSNPAVAPITAAPKLLSQPTYDLDLSNVQKIDRVMRSKGIKINYPFMIIPQKSTFKLIWDSIVLVMIVWLSIFIPWQIAYPDDKISILDEIILAFFICDIAINLRTTFFNEDNEEIIDQKLILRNYVLSINFIIDVSSAFPISEVYQGGSLNVIRALQSHQIIFKSNMIKITRLLRLGRILRLLQNENLKLISHLFNYLFGFLLLFHWITCLWLVIVFYEVDRTQLHSYDAWVPSNLRFIYSSATDQELEQMVQDFYLNTDVYPSSNQYIFSYYSMLMVILGADICNDYNQYFKEPISVGQAFYLVFVGILGSVALAVLFGKMSHILQLSNQKQAQYQKIENEITVLMRRKNIPQELQAKAFEYFDYCWRKHLLFDRSHKDFSDFSKSLQQQCLDFQFKELIYKVPIFFKIDVLFKLIFNKNQEAQEIMKRLKTMVFMPGEYVEEYGEIAQEMFFIIEGVIEKVADKIDDSENIQLTKGDFYGWEAMLGTVKNTENLVSVGFTTIESLQKQDFVNLMNLYPDFQKHVYQSLKENTMQSFNRLCNLLIGVDLFESMDIEQMEKLLTVYMEIRFIENGQVVLVPDEPMNALYLVISGSVDYCVSQNNQNILDDHFTDFDEMIANEISGETHHYEKLNAVESYFQHYVKFLQVKGLVGKLEMFGYLNFDDSSQLSSKLYYVSSAVTQVGVFTNKSLSRMKEEDLMLYQTLKLASETFESNYCKVESQQDDDLERVVKFERVANHTLKNNKIPDRISKLTKDLNGCMEFLQKIAKKN